MLCGILLSTDSVMKKPIITERLTLKSFTDSDKQDFLSIVKDPLVKKTYMLPDFSNEEEEEVFFQRLKKATLDDSRFVYGVYLKDKVIGFINEVTKEGNDIEIGYFISSQHWNHGYASEALQTAIKTLFKLGYKRVYAGFFAGNSASERVMQKCGMQKTDKTDKIVYRKTEHLCYYYEIIKDN